MRGVRRRWRIVGLALMLGALGAIYGLLPSAGAYGLLHPVRRTGSATLPAGCQDEAFQGDGLSLRGWRCNASGVRRGALVYLHGVGDSKASAAGVIARFRKLGLEVVAYDSRAHGESEGDISTYGFREKMDQRVSGVIAAETFSDLRTIATERAPFFFTANLIDRAFRIAEQRGGFEVDAISPRAAAGQIRVPVLLIHGDADTDTRPDHSRRVFAALAGPKRISSRKESPCCVT